MASMPNVVDRTENVEIQKFEKVCCILNRFGRRPSGLIPILQAIQHEYQYLPEEVLTYVATSLDVPPAASSAWPRSMPISPSNPRASTSSASATEPPATSSSLFPSWKPCTRR